MSRVIRRQIQAPKEEVDDPYEYEYKATIEEPHTR